MTILGGITIGTIIYWIVFSYKYTYEKGVSKGIQDAVDTLNEIGFSDEQVKLMNEKFFKEKK